jgi:hypothetical protein
MKGELNLGRVMREALFGASPAAKPKRVLRRFAARRIRRCRHPDMEDGRATFKQAT